MSVSPLAASSVDAVKKATQETEHTFKTQEKLAAQHAQKMTDIFSTGFFSGMQSGFHGMVSSFKTSLQQMVSDAAGAELTQTVFKALPSFSNSHSVGQVFDALGHFASSVFGGFRASGGDVLAGKSYIVGERGPEVFIPRQNGQIMPNNSSTKAPAPISIVMHIHTPDAPSFRRSSGQIRADLGLALQQALKHNT